MKVIPLGIVIAFAAWASASPASGGGSAPAAHAKRVTAPKQKTEGRIGRVTKTDVEWKKELSPEQYRVLRQKGTETAFTGAYWNHHEPGVYRCAGCGLELFRSDEKFDSGTGWPSFWAPAKAGHLAKESDKSFGMSRDEVVCARCGGHLGHVFDDGPEPTGLRYCINSASLSFEKK